MKEQIRKAIAAAAIQIGLTDTEFSFEQYMDNPNLYSAVVWDNQDGSEVKIYVEARANNKGQGHYVKIEQHGNFYADSVEHEVSANVVRYKGEFLAIEDDGEARELKWLLDDLRSAFNNKVSAFNVSHANMAVGSGEFSDYQTIILKNNLAS